MKKYSRPAIVLGGGATTGLGAIRSLGREGIAVLFADHRRSEAVYSKYCRRHFILPEIHNNKEELRRFLFRLRHKLNHSAVLFPGSDSYALILSGLRDELSGYYLPAPKKEAIGLLINKRAFYRSLMNENVPHPTTHFPENLKDVREISGLLSYPTFIKPSVSHSFSLRFRRKGLMANSEADLLRYWAFIDKAGADVMIQEIIPGPPTNHVFLDGYLDRHSNPKAFFARRRIRMWPPAFGNSSLCVSIPISEIAPIRDRLLRYLKAINYHGIFSAELKKDPRDSDFKLLEINSRTSAWFNTLSAKCGVSLMLIAYLDAIGIDTGYSESYKVGVKWIFLKDDFRAAMRMFIDGNLAIREWISSLLGKKDYLLYAKDDLRPFVMSLPQTVLGTA